MSVGQYYKEVLADVGVPLIVYPGGAVDSPVSGEYGKVETNVLTTRPFYAEFVQTVFVAYDTVIAGGDILRILDEHHIALSKKGFSQEGTAWKYSVTLYAANVSGELRRLATTTQQSGGPPPHVFPSRNSENLRLTQSWTDSLFEYDLYALLTAFSLENLDKDAPEGAILQRKKQLYIPTAFGIQPMDQYRVHGGDDFLIESVDSHKYAGVDVCIVSEDSRQ